MRENKNYASACSFLMQWLNDQQSITIFGGFSSSGIYFTSILKLYKNWVEHSNKEHNN